MRLDKMCIRDSLKPVLAPHEISLARGLRICRKQHLAYIHRGAHAGQVPQSFDNVIGGHLEFPARLASIRAARGKFETADALVIFPSHAQAAVHSAHVLVCGVVIGRVHVQLTSVPEHGRNSRIRKQVRKHSLPRQLPLVLDLHEASFEMRQFLRATVSFGGCSTGCHATCPGPMQVEAATASVDVKCLARRVNARTQPQIGRASCRERV